MDVRLGKQVGYCSDRDEYVAHTPYVERKFVGTPSQLRGQLECQLAIDDAGFVNEGSRDLKDHYLLNNLRTALSQYSNVIVGEAAEQATNCSEVTRIFVNGVEVPIAIVDSYSQGRMGNDWDDILEGVEEWELSAGNTVLPDDDSYKQLRPGYKGGNVCSFMNDRGPCATINYDKVAKRRAKNKAARKNRKKK